MQYSKEFRRPRIESSNGLERSKMTEKLKWGIMATGWIADLFVKDLQLAGHQVVAVGSRSSDNALRFAQTHRIPKAYGSYEALVADPDVDIVYVATPHPHHSAGARLALDADKHVLVEKAFTLNAQEAVEIVAAADAKGLVIMEAMWTRFLPHMNRIRAIIAEGQLGDLRTLSADHQQNLSDDPAHRLNAMELGGGALLDLGIYPISFAWDLLGKPAKVSATATFKATGVDAHVATVFTYASGAIATSLSSSTCAGPNRASVVGTVGRVEIDATWYTPTRFLMFDNAGRIVETFDGRVEGRGMQFQAKEMERLVLGGLTSSQIMPPSQSVEIMQTLDDVRSQIGLRYPNE